jgi:hypothetical protein
VYLGGIYVICDIQAAFLEHLQKKGLGFNFYSKREKEMA